MLIIISGLPGTGKTTFARALAQQRDISHFNSDIIRTELGLRGQYDTTTKEKVYAQLEYRTSRTLQQGGDVVVDATFYKNQLRAPYIKMAADRSTPLKWIELKADEATIKQRVTAKREYSEADFEVYRKIKKAYEPLSIPHLVLSSAQLSIEEMLEASEKYLQDETL